MKKQDTHGQNLKAEQANTHTHTQKKKKTEDHAKGPVVLGEVLDAEVHAPKAGEGCAAAKGDLAVLVI